MVIFRRVFAITCICLSICEYSDASIASFDIQDRGQFSGIVAMDTSATYSGTGFLGVARIPIDSRNVVDLVGHYFGLSIDPSIPIGTVIQVDISGLAGKTISSATLSFDLHHSLPDEATAEVVSFETNGQLGFAWDPAPLGQTSASVEGLMPRLWNASLTTSRRASRRLLRPSRWRVSSLQYQSRARRTASNSLSDERPSISGE